MESQLKHELKKAEKTKIGYFTRSAVLVGALALGCAGGMREPAARVDAGPARRANPVSVSENESPARTTPEKGVSIYCNGIGTKIAAGQEIWFGPTWRSVYSFKITGIDGDRITADVKLPVVSGPPAVNIVSVTMKFNSVEFGRSQVEPLVTSMCAQVDEAKRMVEEVGRSAEGLNKAAERLLSKFQGKTRGFPATPAKVRPKLQETQAVPVVIDESAGVAMMLGYGEGLKQALGGLIAMRSGKVSGQQDRVNFAVEGGDAGEIVLRAVGGEADGQRFRLDRKIDLNIEFLFEKAGFLSVPYKIVGLSVIDGEARPGVALDCARDIYMEVFMSEHASGLHPACGKR